MTATLYASTDAGAPQFIDNNAQSNVDIIKAVLIDGYGSRTPVGGWTLAFEDVPGGIICLQPAGVGAPILQITAGTNELAPFGRGFATMSSATVGTNPFPTSAQSSNYQLPMRASTTLSGGDDLWWMLVDDDGEYIYFLGNDSVSTLGAGFFFGKLEFENEAQRRWVISGYPGNIGTTTADWAILSNTQSTQNYTNTPANGVGAEGDIAARREYDFNVTQPNLLSSNLYCSKPVCITGSPGLQFMGTYPGWLIVSGLSTSFLDGGTLFLISGQKYLGRDTQGGFMLWAYDSAEG